MDSQGAGSSGSDVLALEAQLSLSRAALADRIFANLGGGQGSGAAASSSKQSSPSSSTKKKTQGRSSGSSEAFQHRPPTLGLGAKPANAEAAQVARLSVEDARLRGRLANKKGPSGADQPQLGKGKGKRLSEDGPDGDADDSDEDGDALRADRRKTTARHDPFAAKSHRAPAPSKKAPQEQNEANVAGLALNVDGPAATGAQTSAPATQAAPDTSLDLSKLSKSQRKKLNKKRRTEEAEKVQGGEHDEGSRHSQPEATVGSTNEPQGSGISPDLDVNGAGSRDDETAPTGSTLAAETVAYKPSASLPTSSDSASSSMSEHQRALRAKLQGSHFRQLNESLYTSDSADSYQRAQEDPTRMQSYHDGFREQVKKWPQKPYEIIGNLIASEILADWSRLVGGKTGSKAGRTGSSAVPVGAVVADLGAGEGPLTRYLAQHAKLASATPSLPASLRPRVVAYDLLDTEDGVVRGVDCAQLKGLPLPGTLFGETSGQDVAIVDVAVFCLSLMGTDWVRMVAEARRVLRSGGGQLIIAEVTSRLPNAAKKDAFVRIVESLGFRHNTSADPTSSSKDDKNTHFFVLRFTAVPASEQSGRRLTPTELDALVLSGRDVLQPCLYKRR
ncbi:unnamed protein product [Parajaminaea phylloscopi]